METILYQIKSVIRIVIILECSSKMHTLLNIGQHCIFQGIFVVESGHNVGNTMYRADTTPRETNLNNDIATSVVNCLLGKANMEFLTLRGAPNIRFQLNLFLFHRSTKCFSIFFIVCSGPIGMTSCLNFFFFFV